MLAQITIEQRDLLLGLIQSAILCDSVKEELSQAVSTAIEPTVVLGIEGDHPQGATSNCPLDLIVLDHDKDIDDPEHARYISVYVNSDECDELASRAEDTDDLDRNSPSSSHI